MLHGASYCTPPPPPYPYPPTPHSVGDIVELTSKQGKPLVKRDVHLFDESLKGVDLTLWGESARNMNGKPGEILAIK